MSVKIFKSFQNKRSIVETPLVDLKVIEKYSPCLIEFDTVDEFREYLSEHLDEMNAMTTQKLNKTYLISGYTITKIKNEIAVKKKATVNESINESIIERLDRLENIIVLLQQKLQLCTSS